MVRFCRLYDEGQCPYCRKLTLASKYNKVLDGEDKTPEGEQEVWVCNSTDAEIYASLIDLYDWGAEDRFTSHMRILKPDERKLLVTFPYASATGSAEKCNRYKLQIICNEPIPMPLLNNISPEIYNKEEGRLNTPVRFWNADNNKNDPYENKNLYDYYVSTCLRSDGDHDVSAIEVCVLGRERQRGML